jgi:crotonobetainyl-CoA:carnitine CoA-transferase CaiB-like acyl-CoA transferase
MVTDSVAAGAGQGSPEGEVRRMSALSGYRVLELGSTVAGPFCGRLLADFGADVIKIEPIDGDPVRTMGKHHGGKSLYAASIFRNKSLVALNLKSKEGQDLVRRMVTSCDVVIENFRPGTLERWGLGYDELAKLNPRLVMVRISGFGQTGPYKERPGYGFLGDAVGGLLHITGAPDGPPARAAVPITDMVTALYSALGAMMALTVRDRTGRGQCVDAALYECAFSFMESHIPAFQKLGVVPNRAGSRLPGSTPNNLYPTKDGKYVALAAASDPVFSRLASAMGRPDLAVDDRFSTAAARIAHEDTLDEIIARWTASRDLPDLEALLTSASVPASRVFTLEDIFENPHFRARNMLVDIPDDDLGTVTMAAPVPKMSLTPGAIRQSGGQVGRDTRRVLSELAGLTEAEIEALAAAGVIALA